MIEGKVLSVTPITDLDNNCDESFNESLNEQHNINIPVAIEIVINQEPLPVPQLVHHVVCIPDMNRTRRTSQPFCRNNRYSSRFRPRNLHLLYGRQQTRLHPQESQNTSQESPPLAIATTYYRLTSPYDAFRLCFFFTVFIIVILMIFIPITQR